MVSMSEIRLGLGLGHIQCFYQPSAIASALIDFHWEGKSRATPQKKSFRGVGISVVQRDCSTAHQRHGGNGRRTAVVIEVGGDFCSFGLAAHRGSRRYGDRSAAGAERLKLSSTVSQGSEVHEDQHWVGNTRGSRRHRHWDSQYLGLNVP